MRTCHKCQKEFEDSFNFCPRCGCEYKIDTAISSSTQSITNIEDLYTLIHNLQNNANESLTAVLTAQLQVVRYIQTPELIGSTFDVLLQNTKKSIKCAASAALREQIRERTALMINNYIFFMQAKLDAQYMLLQEDYKASRESARQLVTAAADMLSESVANVVALAAPGMVISNIKNYISSIVVKTIFTKQSDKKKSFFSRVIDWFCYEDRLKERLLEYEEKLNDFYLTLEDIFEKLERRKNIIGKNDLIAELINRYKYPLVSKWQSKIEQKNSIFIDRLMVVGKYFAIALGGLLAIQLVVLFVRWVYLLLASLFTTVESGWAARQWYHFGVIIGIITGLLAIYLIIVGVWHLISIMRLQIKKRKNYKRLTKIQKHFEENDLDLECK